MSATGWPLTITVSAQAGITPPASKTGNKNLYFFTFRYPYMV
jgi:hypothetical protein